MHGRSNGALARIRRRPSMTVACLCWSATSQDAGGV